jgi:hypothetical protein
MQEPVAATSGQTSVAFARLWAAIDALSSVIAGFALLAGARAFMFIALLGWREPVLGGAGLVLLALIGWLRWQCGSAVAATMLPAAQDSGREPGRVNGSCGGHPGATSRLQPACAESRHVACYNRSKQRASTRCIGDDPRQSFGQARTQA